MYSVGKRIRNKMAALPSSDCGENPTGGSSSSVGFVIQFGENTVVTELLPHGRIRWIF